MNPTHRDALMALKAAEYDMQLLYDMHSCEICKERGQFCYEGKNLETRAEQWANLLRQTERLVLRIAREDRMKEANRP